MEKTLHLDQHISQQFNEDLEDLKSQCLSMGGLVEKQLKEAVQALINADSEAAEQIISEEQRVNELEVSVDEQCLNLLALRQPAASDLRLVLVVGKVVRDLERVGDEAEKIAKMAVKLSEQGELPRGYVELRHIGATAAEMLHDTLDALARFDTGVALNVIKRDKVLDQEYKSAVREMITYMMEDPRSISRVLDAVLAVRAIERIGDHARNICENVIYQVKGKDVRHLALNQVEQELRLSSKR